MFIDCAVPSARIPGQHVYTYFAQQAIAPGTLVLVPFGKKEVTALVITCKTTTSIKKVLPVVKILFAQPVVTKNQLALFHQVTAYYHSSLSIVVGLAVPEFPIKVLKQTRQTKVHRTRQQLILVPTIERLTAVKSQLEQRRISVLEYHSDQTPTQRAEAYLSVLHGQAQTILSTRTGLFLPFQQLQLIRMYDEHDWSYKESRMPMYHALDIAIFLRALTSARLLIIDPCPRVQTLYALRHQKPHITFRAPVKSALNTRCILIDTTQEKQLGNNTNIAIATSDAILEALNCQEPILLFNPLKNDLYETSNLRRTIVDVNKLLLLSGIHTGRWHQDKQGSIATFTLKDIMFLTVATARVLYHHPIPSYALISVIHTDALLNMPEFRAHERTYALLTQLRRLLKSHGKMIIQTDRPDSPTLQAFRKSDYRSFVKAELIERKNLGYPPFQDILLLSYTTKMPATTIHQAERLITNLSPTLETQKIDWTGPFASLHNPGEIRILLKSTDRSLLLAILEHIPKTWRATFDPENILG